MAINHPCIDGNKGVAFAVTDTFLRINRSHFTVDSDAIYNKLIKLFDAGMFRFDVLEKWMQKIISAD